MKLKYVFDPEGVDNFQYCPFCGGDVMEVYAGDHLGAVRCFECEKELEFRVVKIIEGKQSKYPVAYFSNGLDI